MAYKKKPKSTFQKVVFVFVIVMLALTLLSVLAMMV